MSHVPEQLKGVEFEAAISDAADREEKSGVLTMDRYGVTLSVQNGKTTGISSKPDFEGVFNRGSQFVIEAKVCSGPSFPMTADKIKPRQVSFMLTRSRFGVPCFLLIHWCARRLVKSIHPAMTVAIPVTPTDPRWQRFVDAYAAAKRDKKAGGAGVVESQGSLSRDESLTIGRIVPWRVPKGCRKPLPCLMSFLQPDTAPEFPEFEENADVVAPPPLESEGGEIEALKGGCPPTSCSHLPLPVYYVGHPDGSFSVADPQPVTSGSWDTPEAATVSHGPSVSPTMRIEDTPGLVDWLCERARLSASNYPAAMRRMQSLEDRILGATERSQTVCEQMDSSSISLANVKVWHGGENGCQSEAKEGRCPPLPLPSCSPS